MVTAIRRWIIGKDRKICPRACLGYTTPTATVKIVDQALGTIHRKCRECGAEETNRLDSFKDKRACKRCKNVYDVTVHLWLRLGAAGEERWKEQCSICDLEVSASHHYNTAIAFKARAAKLRAEQKQKLVEAELKKIETPSERRLRLDRLAVLRKRQQGGENNVDVPHDFHPDPGPRDFGDSD